MDHGTGEHLGEQQGGHITMRSDGTDKGSCFIVRLPLAAQTGQEATPPVQVPKPSRSEHKRILIVDDNEDAASMMALLLGKWGHEIRLAHNGQEALAAGAAWLPEIVLMDIGMPVMDGHEACERMRKVAWGRDAYIVALTGWGQQEDKLRSEQAGFDHHLVKPVSSEVLRSLIAAAVAARADRA